MKNEVDYWFVLNDRVDKKSFDQSKFSLKFPFVDDIVAEICKQDDDITIAKIDMARGFRNLRVDPVGVLN